MICQLSTSLLTFMKISFPMKLKIALILALISLISYQIQFTECFSHRVEDEVDIEELSLKESEDEPIGRLQFSAFQSNFDLPLEEAEGVFADDFRLMSTWEEPETGNVILRENNIKVEGESGSFYSIQGETGTVYLQENDDGIRVEGIIDDKIRILPQTPNMKNGAHFHKVVRLSRPMFNSDSFSADYDIPKLIPPRHQLREMKDTAYIEVLVVFDYENSAKFNFNYRAIRRYLGIFWNSVQKRFSQIQLPKVKLVLSGAVVITQIKHEPFIRKNIVNSSNMVNKVDGAKMLEDFGEWLYIFQNGFPKFDLAMVQTGMDMGLWMRDLTFTDSLLGRAYVGTVCKKDDYNKKMWNCGEGEDEAPMYTGIRTIAHEIGHILNSSHDGERASKLCHKYDGYIMGIPNDDNPRNVYQFSSCSVKSIQQFLSSQSPCVWNNPIAKLKLIDQLPGNGMTLKDVCIGWFGKGSSVYGEVNVNEVCKRLWCDTPTGDIKTHGHPPEGTSCGKDLMCIEGMCKRRAK